jgi:predicted SnoaL-like aldol condensation-catalyzing enzyme
MPETNEKKKCVVSFYNLVFNQNEVRNAVEQYVGDEFIQHNPNIETGKQGFIQFFERMAREHPRKRVTIKRVFAEGDHVILHCLQEWPGVQNFATVDIFRLNADGKIVEHWDVMQVMPQKSANPNGMF